MRVRALGAGQAVQNPEVGTLPVPVGETRNPELRLNLFGGPEIRGGGQLLSLSPTQDAFLALVWGHETKILTRSRAIWLLWEEEDHGRARQRMRQLLHELRGRLGLRSLGLSGDELLHPDPEVLPCDLATFRSALRLGELQEARTLLEKGFCSRLRRCPSQHFDDWLAAKRERLRRDLRSVAARMWDDAHPAGDWRPARAAAEVLYALDPSGESSLRMLVEARAMTGGIREAEAAFAAFIEAMPSGSALDPATLTLIDRVRALTREVTAEAAADDPPPLVGRKLDLEAARAVLGRVRKGAFEFLLLKGEAGVGKTRLLEEIRREASLKGFRCLHARPVELEQRIPLNPLIDALSVPDVGRHLRALHNPWKSVIGVILPHLLAENEPLEVPPIAESSLSRRLYDAFSILFSRLAAEEPTLLFIDDLQWADATSIAVLQFVQRRWRSGPLGIVASIRPDLVPRDADVGKYLAEGPGHPVTAIELRDLGEEDAERLVLAVSKGSLNQGIRRRLSALGGRNPFYVIELTKDYLTGHLHLPELPADALAVPISIRQILDPRLETLSAVAAAVASYLAVWGRWADVPALAALTGTTLEACTAGVEELERRRLVTLQRGMVSVAHELFRGALYHRMSEARRAFLHRTLGNYLQSTAQPVPGELAIHFDRAGERAKAAELARQAADSALENGAMAEAAYFLQLVTENVSDMRLKAEATADLAKVLHMNREIARANPLLELAATRLRESGMPGPALRMDIRRVEGLAEVGNTPMADLLDRLKTIKTAARTAEDWEALALALDSELHLLHRSGKVAAIRELFGEVQECADRGGPAAACVANASLALDVLFGDGSQALDRARAAVRIAEEEARHHLLRAQTMLYLALLYRGYAYSPEANELLVNARAESERSGDLILRYNVEANVGVSRLDAGDLDAAGLAFEKAETVLAGAEASLIRVSHYYNLGELAVRRRNPEAAIEYFNRAEALLGGSTRPLDVAQLVNAGIGLCSMQLGSLAEARRREAEILPAPESWYFDPSLVLEFQSNLLTTRNQPQKALALLKGHGETFRDRLTPAWLKVLLVECRLARRIRASHWRERASLGVEVASALGFQSRVREFRELID